MEKFTSPTFKLISFIIISLGLIIILSPFFIIISTSFVSSSLDHSFTFKYYQEA